MLGEFKPGDETWYLLGMDVIGQQRNGAWGYFGYDGLGSMRMMTDAAGLITYATSYASYGMPFEVGGMPNTSLGFRGEFSDPSGLLDLRARYLSPRLGTFLSKDPFSGYMTNAMLRNGYSYVRGNPINGAVGELLSLNGYAYVNRNPVNRIDPSGMCWVNSSASPEQQSQCSNAWHQYTNIISNTYTQNWPRDVRILVTQEADYWANLPYSEFVSQWNSSRPPVGTDPGGAVWQGSLPIMGGISFANPAPGPEDLIAIGGLCIAGIWALAANAGAISLPLRQTYYFSDSTERANEDEIAWPIPPTRDGAKVVLYRAIDPPELAFVRSVGFTNYGFSPNASGKYFALTLAGVTQFAGADINSNAVFTLTRIRFSPPIILFGYFFNDVGQQGAGWSIHFSDEALLGLYADLAASNERIVIIGAV